ncbi:MAG: hypothetical protein DME55_07625 [Verrucomicrobia bacterium]|nr:MAG: hypothetical protein DME55_07625 [Verrucomicrobiota bacterium]
MIQLNDDVCIMMPDARREHLIEWRAIETDPANLAYIDTTLREWDPADRFETLGQLESAP